MLGLSCIKTGLWESTGHCRLWDFHDSLSVKSEGTVMTAFIINNLNLLSRKHYFSFKNRFTAINCFHQILSSISMKDNADGDGPEKVEAICPSTFLAVTWLSCNCKQQCLPRTNFPHHHVVHRKPCTNGGWQAETNKKITK